MGADTGLPLRMGGLFRHKPTPSALPPLSASLLVCEESLEVSYSKKPSRLLQTGGPCLAVEVVYL